MAGTKETSIRSYDFFTTGALTGAGAVGSYAENVHEFIDSGDGTPFLSHSIKIENGGVGDISFRFSAAPGAGSLAHGVVKASETIQLDYKRAKRIYLSGTVLGSAFRFWSW